MNSGAFWGRCAEFKQSIDRWQAIGFSPVAATFSVLCGMNRLCILISLWPLGQ
jgi:hypothetical protein